MGSNNDEISTQLSGDSNSISPSNSPKSRTSSIGSDLSDLTNSTVIEGYTRSNTPDSTTSSDEVLTQKARYMLSEEDETAQQKFHQQLIDQLLEDNPSKNIKIKHFLSLSASQYELLGLAYFKTISSVASNKDPYKVLASKPQDLNLKGLHFNELISKLLFRPVNVSALANKFLQSSLMPMLEQDKDSEKATLDEMLKDKSLHTYLQETKDQTPDLTNIEFEALKKLTIINIFLMENAEEIQASIETLNTFYLNKSTDRKIDEKSFIYQIISNLLSKIEDGENVLTNDEKKIREYIGASDLAKTIIAIEHEKTTPEYITKELMSTLSQINSINIIENKDKIIAHIEKKSWFLNGEVFCGDSAYSKFLTSFIQNLKQAEEQDNFAFELAVIKNNYFIDSVPALKIMRDQFNIVIEDKSELTKVKSLLQTINPNFTDQLIENYEGGIIELFVEALDLHEKSKNDIDIISAKFNSMLGDKKLYGIENKSLPVERCIKLQEALFSRYLNPNKSPPFQSLYCHAYGIDQTPARNLLTEISSAKHFNIFDTSKKDKQSPEEINFEVLLQSEKADYILKSTLDLVNKHKKLAKEHQLLKLSKNILKIDKNEPDITIQIAENIIRILTQNPMASMQDINRKSFTSDRLAKLYRDFITKLISNRFELDNVKENLEKICQIESIFHDESDQYIEIANQSVFGYNAEEALISICYNLETPFSSGHAIVNLTKDQISYNQQKLKENIPEEILNTLNQHKIPLDELIFFFNKATNLNKDEAKLQTTPEIQIQRVKNGFLNIANLIDNGSFAILKSVGLNPEKMTTIFMPSNIERIANGLRAVSKAGIDISNPNFAALFIKPYHLDINGKYDYSEKVISNLKIITDQTYRIQNVLATEGNKFSTLLDMNPEFQKFIQIDILNNLLKIQNKTMTNYGNAINEYINNMYSSTNLIHNIRKIRKALTNKLEGNFLFKSHREYYETALMELDEAFKNLNFSYNHMNQENNLNDAILADEGLSKLLLTIDEYGFLYPERRNAFFNNIPEQIVAQCYLPSDIKTPKKEFSNFTITVMLVLYAIGMAISNLFSFRNQSKPNYHRVSLDEVQIEDNNKDQATTRMLRELSSTIDDIEATTKDIAQLSKIEAKLERPNPRHISVEKIIENYNQNIELNDGSPNRRIDVTQIQRIIPLLASSSSNFLDVFENDDAKEYLPNILKHVMFAKTDENMTDEAIIKDLNLMIEAAIEMSLHKTQTNSFKH